MASSKNIKWDPTIKNYIPPKIKNHAKAMTKPFQLKLFIHMKDLNHF
jgi:hypothetical protein